MDDDESGLGGGRRADKGEPAGLMLVSGTLSASLQFERSVPIWQIEPVFSRLRQDAVNHVVQTVTRNPNLTSEIKLIRTPLGHTPSHRPGNKNRPAGSVF
jgi:hypothetical protein